MPKTLRNSQPLVIAVLVLAAVGLRLLLLPFTNHDLTDAVIPWYEYMIRNGGLQAINGLLDSANGFPAYIYSPPYLYLLAAAIPLTKWFSTVEVIKLVSIVFDFLSAIAMFYLVRLKFPTGWKKWAGFLLYVSRRPCSSTAPTGVNLTGFTQLFYWSACILCVPVEFRCHWCSLPPRWPLNFQAVLFVPLYVVLFFQKKISWWKFFIVPIVFFLWMVPAYLNGYPLLAPFTTYLGGATQFQSITMNTPNLYTFLPNTFYRLIVPLGTFVGAVICLMLIWMTIRRENEFTTERIILFTLLISVIMPFILPKMHERYFYPAALFSIILFFYQPRYQADPVDFAGHIAPIVHPIPRSG